MAVSESDGKAIEKAVSDSTNDKMSEKNLETSTEEKGEECVSNGIAKTADTSVEEKEPMDVSEESGDNKSPKSSKSPAQSGVKKRSSRSRSSRSSRSSSVDKPAEKIKEEPVEVKEEKEKEAEFVKPSESMSVGDFPGFESSPVPDLKKEQYIKLLRVSLGRDHDDESMSQGANSDQMSIDNPPSVDSDNFAMGEGAPRRSTRTKKSLNIDMSNPDFRKPFDFGWTRELVYRSMHEGERTRRNADVYYYNSAGKKFRSYRDLHDYLSDGLEEKNFTFFKEPIGINDPTKEIIRGAKAKPPAKVPTEENAQKKAATPKLKPKPAPKAETPKTMPKVVFYKNNSNKNKNLSNKANLYKKRKSAGPDDFDAMSDTDWSPEQKQNGVKRPSDSDLSPPPEKKFKQIAMRNTSTELKENFMMNLNAGFTALLHAFQYLKVHELLRAVCVSQMWRHIASHRSLWETVRMKNSRVRDWDGFGQALRYHCTKNLDLRKMLLPETQEQTNQMWEEFGAAVAGLTHLKRIDFGRCTSQAIEIVAESNPQLESIVTLSLRSSEIDFKSIGNCVNLVELKLKSASGIEIKDLSALKNLKQLKVLALTTVKNLEGIEDALSESIENLELGDCTKFTQYFATDALPKLKNLKRLRLEKGQGTCPTIPILDAISDLPNLTQLELINFDIKPGFDTSLARCSNLKTLLIIPTYVTQSATTNHVVMGGVSKLSQSLTYFIWGLTLELLRVTDLFIDQVEGSKSKVANSSPGVKKASGDSIPILKPMTDVNEAKEGQSASQVDILGLPKLQRVLSTILPTTKIKILKVPFSATWRQTVTDSSAQ